MKLLANLCDADGIVRSEFINFDGTLEEAKIRLYYIRYGTAYYEWCTYNSGFLDVDYIAEYHHIEFLPNDTPAVYYDIGGDNDYILVKCECGAEKTGSDRHSSWCAKDMK